MTATINQNPEQVARDKIDQMLREAEWTVQSKDKVDLFENAVFVIISSAILAPSRLALFFV